MLRTLLNTNSTLKFLSIGFSNETGLRYSTLDANLSLPHLKKLQMREISSVSDILQARQLIVASHGLDEIALTLGSLELVTKSRSDYPNIWAQIDKVIIDEDTTQETEITNCHDFLIQALYVPLAQRHRPRSLSIAYAALDKRLQGLFSEKLEKLVLKSCVDIDTISFAGLACQLKRLYIVATEDCIDDIVQILVDLRSGLEELYFMMSRLSEGSRRISLPMDISAILRHKTTLKSIGFLEHAWSNRILADRGDNNWNTGEEVLFRECQLKEAIIPWEISFVSIKSTICDFIHDLLILDAVRMRMKKRSSSARRMRQSIHIYCVSKKFI